ncbi:hypothetical protein A6U87_13030 [Rhizobium sp. AC44/96]|uniref:Kazal-type serine protease inhibitor domain-containing protein n=1 Tax=Rhizobium sp. AC44/96 TaxID=1841654 RepID=UPI00080F86FF|nr:Kazal-type serine protease inhibitor domain-containing protein [Rhizobium sp. AC44/96]OCJ04950.1 hypothetical protein A6U87_13030 [Rhizobium sp. AC44/96]
MFAGLISPKKWSLFLLAPMLAACTVDVDPGYSRPPPRPRPPQTQMCTMEYAPVCGQRGGRTQTFANSCQARSNGFAIVGHGECRRQPPVTPMPPHRPQPQPPRPGRPEPTHPERPAGICTREYRPVCAQRGPQTRTFPNACEARNGGFRIIADGQCR